MTASSTLLVCGLICSPLPVAVAQEDWLYRKPGLERLVDGQWQAVDWRIREARLEALIEQCIDRFRVPFLLPEGTRIVPGEDDKELTKERTRQSSITLLEYGPGIRPPPDTKLAHGAIDVGSRISSGGGQTLEKLGHAPVRAVCPEGYIRGNGVYLEQVVVAEAEPFRLIVRITYGHVRPAPCIGVEWQPTPAGIVGTLEGQDRWTSLDPALTAKMPDKGNHIHLIVRGIYDLDALTFIAHSEQLKGRHISARHDDLLRKRARFYNERLLPVVTGSR